MTWLSVSHKSKGGPSLFGEQLKNLEPFIYPFIALMEDFLREESTMFNCHQNKVENTALCKRNDMFWKNKIKTGF